MEGRSSILGGTLLLTAANLLLQVHDELIVECPEEMAQGVAQVVQEQMEQVAHLNVPLVAEAKWGKSWYEAK